MVFVNGYFNPEHSHVGDLPRGAKVRSLIESLADGPLNAISSTFSPSRTGRLFRSITPFSPTGLSPFEAGVHLNKPLPPGFPSSNSGLATQSHIRNLLLMEEGPRPRSSSIMGQQSSSLFHEHRHQVALEKDAKLDHTKIQQESPLGFSYRLLAPTSQGSHLTPGCFHLGEIWDAAKWKRTSPGPMPGAFSRAWPWNGKQHLDVRTFVTTRWTLPKRTAFQDGGDGTRREFLTAGCWCGKTRKRPTPADNKNFTFPRPPRSMQAPAPNLRG